MKIEEKTLYIKVIVAFSILILILLISLLSQSYEVGVQKCINSGKSENYCRTELSK